MGCIESAASLRPGARHLLSRPKRDAGGKSAIPFRGSTRTFRTFVTSWAGRTSGPMASSATARRLSMYVRYMQQQHLIERPIAAEELFALNALE